MAIYTKTGDKGTTSLASGERVSKTDVRIDAYGTVDELNSWVGMLRACAQHADEQLQWIQNKLFNLGAALSEALGEWITGQDVLQLESWIDAMQTQLPKQKAFLLPAGSEAVCRCHVCRTICRRAERKMIEIGNAEEKNDFGLKFINRLSDYFFVLSRFLGYENNENEAIWCKN